MFRVFDTITNQYDLQLTFMAVMIGLAAAISTSVMLERVKNRAGMAKFIWLLTVSAVIGFGIWATHFVALLAYQPGPAFNYERDKTILSLFLIIGATLPALQLILSRTSRFASGFGAMVFGLSISAMHYTGIEGLLTEGQMVWNKNYVIASVIVGPIFCLLAIKAHKQTAKVKSLLSSAGLFALAFFLTHFIGMSALEIIPAENSTSPVNTGLAPSVLGTMIAAFAIVVLQAGVGIVILDSWLYQKSVADDWQLTRQEILLSSMGEVAKIGAWELDIETRTPHWSPQTCALHKVDETFVPDLDTAASYFPGHARSAFLRAIDQACRGNGFDIELPFQCGQREERWVRVVSKTMMRNGYPAKLIGAYQDITIQKKERNALEIALREADKANRLKSEFLANMSHEIRTPMNGVLGMAQLLKTTKMDEKQQAFADVILSSGNSLLSLINDILDTSKIEAGLLELHNEAFNLAELLTSATGAVSGIALQKGIAIYCTIDENVEKLYFGDSPRIRQVLINLLGNALKFTEQGQVAVTVTLDKMNYLRFEVTDTGPGIPPEQQVHVFGRFTQADGSTTRKHGGTGLGLAISHDLIKLMNGSIGLYSQLGQGSTFWFRIPLPAAEISMDQVA